ncbi:CDP-alcohol phosphatidyltransferase family protein [Nocardioides panacis]|uniref:CDP-alcohol phosphatidyltransferase family protein n=1 Tax=Nocardioides panacis TaxID=2849501 RepID=A0A975Y0G4_9ACTN|nr:CDP-alcohol phosphatidyltransferase family protein [Nocardioides panacis]QWZ08299.1 CDP-alcohol phosphatidyltransferase family protein [Nocardioides panacis]
MNGGRVPMVQRGPMLGLLAQLSVLAGLAATVGLGAPGWAVGLACGSVTAGALTVALPAHGLDRLGPADRVTLTRAVLVGGVAALVAAHPAPVALLVGLAAVALVLDRVDGEVARRTGSVSGFGAAFDMEVDAFLVLVLSVYVARTAGAWVLLIGLARYALWVAGRFAPWLREPVPTRPWAKVVAAVQGVVLTAVAADLLPAAVEVTALVLALVLLTESFAHQVLWLRRHRVPAPVRVGVPT